jgi:hypothetical protein
MQMSFSMNESLSMRVTFQFQNYFYLNTRHLQIRVQLFNVKSGHMLFRSFILRYNSNEFWKFRLTKWSNVLFGSRFLECTRASSDGRSTRMFTRSSRLIGDKMPQPIPDFPEVTSCEWHRHHCAKAEIIQPFDNE